MPASSDLLQAPADNHVAAVRSTIDRGERRHVSRQEGDLNPESESSSYEEKAVCSQRVKGTRVVSRKGAPPVLPIRPRAWAAPATIMLTIAAVLGQALPDASISARSFDETAIRLSGTVIGSTMSVLGDNGSGELEP